jgi:redox-sensitive bicupin YhaK (pirin superfamily)
MFPLLDRDGPNPCELFQIWLNLPADDKMVDPYFTMLWGEDMPVHVAKDGDGRATRLTVIAGAFADLQPLPPPPSSWASRPEADVAIWHLAHEAGATFTLPPVTPHEGATTPTVRTVYVFEGTVTIGDHHLEASTGAVVRAASRSRSPPGPTAPRSSCCRAGPSASRWPSTGRS